MQDHDSADWRQHSPKGTPPLTRYPPGTIGPPHALRPSPHMTQRCPDSNTSET
ncbi:hypothetical protein NY08_3687 [Rhodococcus sp. B7740]|nr:hypothetical protein NY08_3687 [Rhodococcus sp. B7740]